MSDDKDTVAISYYIEEIENNENNLNIEDFMNEIDATYLNDELLVPQMLNYNDNFTVKELLLICEYYGFARDLKNNKCNKTQIIHFLVVFESDPNNSEIVFKRQNMWFYMNELKSDKFMKKYMIW
jgi:hypothetical protein